MAHEIGIQYELTGPDGTRAVLQNSGDPDFVGYISEITGLDSAEVREQSEDKPGTDGAKHGDFFAGRRPITIEGTIHVGSDSATIRNSRADRLLRASLALRQDAVLRWQETGGVPRQISLRRQQPTRLSGLRPKKFLVAMVAEDPRIVSQEEHSLSILAGALGTSGTDFPLDFPLDFQEVTGSAGTVSVTNAGNGDAIPTFEIAGPIVNPRVLNNTTGEEQWFIVTLAAGETLIVNGHDRSVLLNGAVDRYGAYDFTTSEWWTLQPGANDVRLLSTSYSAPAGLTVRWRDSWL